MLKYPPPPSKIGAYLLLQELRNGEHTLSFNGMLALFYRYVIEDLSANTSLHDLGTNDQELDTLWCEATERTIAYLERLAREGLVSVVPSQRSMLRALVVQQAQDLRRKLEDHRQRVKASTPARR